LFARAGARLVRRAGRQFSRRDVARRLNGRHKPMQRPSLRDHDAEAYREARQRERDVILTDGSRRPGAGALAACRAHGGAHDGEVGRARHGNANAQKWRLNGVYRLMQYRIQFLDGNASVILDLIADARNAAGAIALVADLDWPPHAVTMRLLYVDGREAISHFSIKGETKK
jgi:hypothetical protein